jgi:hypothetical protein
MANANSVEQPLRFYTLDGWQFDQLSVAAQKEILKVLEYPRPNTRCGSRSQSPIGQRKPAPRTDNYKMYNTTLGGSRSPSPIGQRKPAQRTDNYSNLKPTVDISYFERECPFFVEEYFSAKTYEEINEAIKHASDYIKEKQK